MRGPSVSIQPDLPPPLGRRCNHHNQPTMKNTPVTRTLVGALLLIASLGFTHTATAQETLIAAGNINASGDVGISTSPIGATVSSTRNGVGSGSYDIQIDSIGAFASNTEDDFLIEVGIERGDLLNDNGVTAEVKSVNADQLVIDVQVADYEDLSSNVSSEARDEDFYFVIRRITAGQTSFVGDSRHLLAIGTVDTDGTLLASFGVDGVNATSQKNAEGDYTVTLSKPGGFVGDSSQDYLFLATPIDSGSQDQIISADVGNNGTSTDDAVVFAVRTTDVQDNPNADVGVAEDENFGFVVYALNAASEAGSPDSRLIAMMASVAPNGDLVRGASSHSGGSVTSTRVGAGRFDVDFVSAGAFAGKSAEDYIGIATVRTASLQDRQANVLVEIVNPSLLRVNVAINDLEQDATSIGDPEDDDFYVTLFDTDPAFQPDLRIGRKRNLTKMKGNNRYNNSGGGQGIKVKLPGARQKKYFFAVENDGRSIDDFRVKEKGAGSEIKSRYFRLTGGRQNVTARIRTNKEVASDVEPGDIVLFQSRLRYRSSLGTPRRKIKLLGRSIANFSRDTVKAIVVPDNN